MLVDVSVRSGRYCLSFVLAMVAIGCVDGARTERGGHEQDWPSVSGNLSGHRYFPSPNLSPDAVDRLKVAWQTRIDNVDSELPCAGCASNGWRAEATPLFRKGVLYVVSPRGRVVALEARVGTPVWTFDPKIRTDVRYLEGFTSRGVALWEDPLGDPAAVCAARIFVATVDARLIAVDAQTGLHCREFGAAGELFLSEGMAPDGSRAGISDYSITSPPLVVGNVVVVGSTVDGHSTRVRALGSVRAFDARSGTLLWTFDGLRSSRLPSGRIARPRGGANVWSLMSADPEMGLVFLPTASAAPNHFGGDRPGDNEFANSVVAVRARDGFMVWSYQLVHHDLWDYDVATQPMLVTLGNGGDTVPALIAMSKSGTVALLDRRTGIALTRVLERRVPSSDVPGEHASPTQPNGIFDAELQAESRSLDRIFALSARDSAYCASWRSRVRFEGTFTPPSLSGTRLFPGVWGGPNWDGAAWDPIREILIVPNRRIGTVLQLVPMSEVARLPPATPGEQRLGDPSGAYLFRRRPFVAESGVPCSPPPWGEIFAFDLDRRELRWRRPLGAIPALAAIPRARAWGSLMFGGSLLTAGGLIFIGGSQDDRFRAIDIESGETLWEHLLPAGGQSAPMAYRIGTTEFIAMLAGGRSGIGSRGSWVVAFRLDNSRTRKWQR